MAGRRLGPDEAALWARVKATVRPLAPAADRTPSAPEVDFAEAMAPPGTRRLVTPRADQPSRPVRPERPASASQDTLDGGWDKRLARGIVVPDATLDLHGHTLRSAHALLDAGLDRAIRRGDRVLLLVTGRPPRAESERPHARGAIRAAIADWLAASRHAGAIAAVRGAHPRHGGQGALYIVLRRAKTRP